MDVSGIFLQPSPKFSKALRMYRFPRIATDICAWLGAVKGFEIKEQGLTPTPGFISVFRLMRVFVHSRHVESNRRTAQAQTSW